MVVVGGCQKPGRRRDCAVTSRATQSVTAGPGVPRSVAHPRAGPCQWFAGSGHPSLTDSGPPVTPFPIGTGGGA